MKLRNVPFPVQGMSDEHIWFVIEYLKTRRATVAAEAIGRAPEDGYKLLQRDDIKNAISVALYQHYREAAIDAAWVLQELVDNHHLCRQQGDLKGSNAALRLIAQHASVDAFAAEKIELAGSEQIRDRLLRARKRLQGSHDEQPKNPEPSFL